MTKYKIDVFRAVVYKTTIEIEADKQYDAVKKAHRMAQNENDEMPFYTEDIITHQGEDVLVHTAFSETNEKPHIEFVTEVKCYKCGDKHESTQRFCPECGACK